MYVFVENKGFLIKKLFLLNYNFKSRKCYLKVCYGKISLVLFFRFFSLDLSEKYFKFYLRKEMFKGLVSCVLDGR